MPLNSIQQEWNRFAEMVFAQVPYSEVQYREMKKAFFAGNWSMFTALEEIGEPHVTEQQCHQFLIERKAECEAFKREMTQEHVERN